MHKSQKYAQRHIILYAFANAYGHVTTATMSRAFQLTLIAGMLATGSVNTLVKKFSYDMTSVGRFGETQAFRKARYGGRGRRVCTS